MEELKVKTQEELIDDIRGYIDTISSVLDRVVENPACASYYIQQYADYIKDTAQVLAGS